MRTATVQISSVPDSPYSQSGFFISERGTDETPDQFETRCWREKMHVTSKGAVFVPPMAFKKALEGAGRYLGMKVPGAGNKRYTGLLTSSVLVTEPLVLGIQAEDVEGEWLWMNADGVSGGGKRVKRCFPKIENWSGDVNFYIVDDRIGKDIFAKHMQVAGLAIGIGRFRPENGGYYGRFSVGEISWSNGKG